MDYAERTGALGWALANVITLAEALTAALATQATKAHPGTCLGGLPAVWWALRFWWCLFGPHGTHDRDEENVLHPLVAR